MPATAAARPANLYFMEPPWIGCVGCSSGRKHAIAGPAAGSRVNPSPPFFGVRDRRRDGARSDRTRRREREAADWRYSETCLPGRHDVCSRTRHCLPPALQQGRMPGRLRALRVVLPSRPPLASDRRNGLAPRQRHRVAPPRARFARRSLRDRSRHARPALSHPCARARHRGGPGRWARQASGRKTSTPWWSAPVPAIFVRDCRAM